LAGELQTQVDADERLAHTDAKKMCQKVKAILAEHKEAQGSATAKAFCDKTFHYSGDYYKYVSEYYYTWILNA
jgi:hypothetical protein